MAARAIWKARIRLRDVLVPVKLYSAIEDRKVHFRLLHAKDRVPVTQHMVDPRTEEIVPAESIRRGVETAPGEIVMLTAEDLRALEPEDSREIVIQQFVDSTRIGRQWYDRPYYLGPDGDPPTYFALADALEREKKEGIARWTMRKTSYNGALRFHDRYLMLTTLRPAGEIISASELPRPQGRPLDRRELEMAVQLVQAMEGNFDPHHFQDEYRQRVLELVDRKARGETISFPKPPRRRAEVVSLADMLEKSVLRVKKERKIA
ncbi:MAG: Ku protein [Desulfobacterales bacterium]